MVLRLSYLHNGNSCTGKASSLYWISLLIVIPVKWEVITVNGRPVIYVYKKERKGTDMAVYCMFFFVFFFRFCAFLFIFLLYKDQCMRYRVYTECWFHKAGDDFVRLSVLYTCVMKKKMWHALPSLEIFFFIHFEYWLIKCWLAQWDHKTTCRSGK